MRREELLSGVDREDSGGAGLYNRMIKDEHKPDELGNVCSRPRRHSMDTHM